MNYSYNGPILHFRGSFSGLGCQKSRSHEGKAQFKFHISITARRCGNAGRPFLFPGHSLRSGTINPTHHYTACKLRTCLISCFEVRLLKSGPLYE